MMYLFLFTGVGREEGVGALANLMVILHFHWLSVETNDWRTWDATMSL